MFLYENYLKIRNLRRARDADVSRATGIPPSTFSDWKHGRSHPRAEKMIKISEFLDVSLEELSSGELNSPFPLSGLTGGAHEAPVFSAAYDVRIRELVILFRDLSDEGQLRVLQYARDLFDTGKYKKFKTYEKQA